ncbi:simple sugar transport system permease protein [Lachnospiraceae bacterium C7]|nr:simple sugar transport system permease protein [Lachnospiraceae bacterium C7]
MSAGLLILIKFTLLSGIVLMYVALGGCFSEHSGVINIALEGVMVIGALFGILTLCVLPKSLPGFLIVTISIFVAMLSGIIYSSLLAFASINLKADQTIGGTALNILATAIALVVVKRYNNVINPGSQSPKLTYDNSLFLFKVGPLTLNVFIVLGLILLIASYLVLYKTKFGLHLRACGEHPQAADSVGINVYKMRWAGVLISGGLAGIGGMAYIVPSVQIWNFEVGVGGMGFLALAVMIFGKWHPGYIFLGSLFFAIFKSLANIYDSTFLANFHLTKEIYNMMPFIASLIVLMFTSKNSKAPKAEGIPYDKGMR